MSTMRWLNRGVAIVGGVILLTILSLRVFGIEAPEWTIAGSLIGAWLLGTMAITWLRRKSPLQALAHWDDATDGTSALASAVFFEESPTDNHAAGEELHLERAQQLLTKRSQSLAADLPISRPHWSWVALALALAFAATPGFRAGIALEDLLITDAMRLRAEGEAGRLAEGRKALNGLKELSEEERERVKELGEMLDETAEMLSDASDMTSRELLEALEARARAAEELADELGGEGEEWASKAMLEEMARHADTTDLAAAIQDHDAELSSEQSNALAEKLAAPELSIEAEQRVDEALGRTMEKATEEDKARPVGEHVGQASVNLDQDQSAAAAKDFQTLAEHFRDLARREQARDELKELADQLRESGSNIAQSQLDQMQELGAGDEGAAQPPPGAQDLAQSPQQLPGPANQGVQEMQVPGLQNQNQGQGQQPGAQGLQAPVPGMGQQPPPGQEQGPQVGMAPGGKGEGEGLAAPVPGMAPPPGGGAQGAAALGAAGGSTAAGAGLQAGVGTAEMGQNPTEAMRATKDGVVEAQINDDGDSKVKRVEGGVRAETAQAQKREAAVSFIAVEEEALDEKALPVSRRDQVLRYFTALRKQFEPEDSE